MGEGQCSRSCTMNLLGISRVESRIHSAALVLMNPTATESQEIGSARGDKHGKQDLLKAYLSWKCSSPQHILVCMNNNHIQGKILALDIWLGLLDSAQRNCSIRIITARKRGSEATRMQHLRWWRLRSYHGTGTQEPWSPGLQVAIGK